MFLEGTMDFIVIIIIIIIIIINMELASCDPSGAQNLGGGS